MNLIEHINENLTEIYEGFTLKLSSNVTRKHMSAKRKMMSDVSKTRKIINDSSKSDGDIVYSDNVLNDVYKIEEKHWFSKNDIYYYSSIPGIGARKFPRTEVVIEGYGGEFEDASKFIKAIRDNVSLITKSIIPNMIDYFDGDEGSSSKVKRAVNTGFMIEVIYLESKNKAFIEASIENYELEMDCTLSPLKFELYDVF